MIPNQPQLPAHLRNTKPDPKNAVCRVAVIRRRKRRQAAEKRERALQAPQPEAPMPTLRTHEDFYPDHPEDWIDVTEEARQDSLDETVEQAMASAPTVVRQAALAIKVINTELHEHANTVHGIKDLLLAQNRDVHVLAKTRWWHKNQLTITFFPKTCARSHVTILSRKQNILFINKNGVFFLKYPPQQRPSVHEYNCRSCTSMRFVSCSRCNAPPIHC